MLRRATYFEIAKVLTQYHMTNNDTSIEEIIYLDRSVRLISYSEWAKRNNKTIDELLSLLTDKQKDGFIHLNPIGKKGKLNKNRIYYNDAMPLVRKRFTIAHEYGHYRLSHIEHSKDNEELANTFAANILCNPFEVAELMIQNDCKNIVDGSLLIRKYFNVSNETAEYRYKHYYSDLKIIMSFPIIKNNLDLHIFRAKRKVRTFMTTYKKSKNIHNYTNSGFVTMDELIKKSDILTPTQLGASQTMKGITKK